MFNLKETDFTKKKSPEPEDFITENTVQTGKDTSMKKFSDSSNTVFVFIETEKRKVTKNKDFKLSRRRPLCYNSTENPQITEPELTAETFSKLQSKRMKRGVATWKSPRIRAHPDPANKLQQQKYSNRKQSVKIKQKRTP